jgi:hypothetical protein
VPVGAVRRVEQFDHLGPLVDGELPAGLHGGRGYRGGPDPVCRR